MKIKEMVTSEMPRERLLSHGAKSLSNTELWFFIFYGGKVKLPAFFNTQKAQLPL
ncbi:hypothetical protein U250_00622 [Staphylococcus aureus F62007]|nr:UPF0758 domain-containing protein [Staphylococcus aureus]EVW96941.1 hypothetical protein U250_00622 [Staphylococcus aureus F62007]EVZ71715.1 hypothetical protein U387_01174 [Staphylococcus aureus H27858]EWA06556.1 hypothetical protein U401_01219 [Staphylococcus aureus H64299]